MINGSLVILGFNETDCTISLLETVEQQTLQPTEVVIVDAESTDGSVSKFYIHKAKLHLVTTR